MTPLTVPTPFNLLVESIAHYDSAIRLEADELLPPGADGLSVWTGTLYCVDGAIGIRMPPECAGFPGVTTDEGIHYYTLPFHLIYEETVA